MINIQEIPLTADNQQFSINLGSQQLRLSFIWRDIAGWIMDVHDLAGNPILSGSPLIPNVNLIEQFPYLGIDGWLVVSSDAESGEYPSKTGLGTLSRIYFAQQGEDS